MSTSLFKSLVSNWFGLICAILIGFFISPLVVKGLGPEQYGLWATLVALTTQFAMLDFGMRNALVKYIAQLGNEPADQLEISKLTSSAALILCFLSLISFGCLILISEFALDWFNVDSNFALIFQLALLILAMDTSVEISFGFNDAILAAKERYDLINLVNVGRLIINAILTAYVLYYSAGIAALALINFFTRLGQRLIIRRLAIKQLPCAKSNFDLVSKIKIKQLFAYGFWAFVIVVCSRIIYQIDTIVVAAAIGPVAAGIYAVAVILIEQLRNFAQTASTILTPRMSKLGANEAKETATFLAMKWAKFSSLLAIFVALPIIITGPSFINLWVGNGYQDSSSILIILTLPFFFILPSLGLSSLLYAESKHKTNAKLLFFEAIANLSLSILLVKPLGAIGVACGTAIPAIIFRSIILPIMTSKVCAFNLEQFFEQAYLKTAPFFIVHFALLYSLVTFVGCETWLKFLMTNLISITISGLLVYQYNLDQEEKDYLQRRLKIS